MLESFRSDAPSRSLGELSESLAMAKPTLRRVLLNLMERGYIHQDVETRDYRLGLRCWELGAAAVAALDLRDLARPLLEDLARTTGEQVTLWVYDNGDAVCIDRVESSHRVRSYTGLGTRESTVGLAAGRCLLADRSPEEVRMVLASVDPAVLRALGHSRRRLTAYLRAVVERGYDISSGDRWPDVSAVGAPVRDHTERVLAAVGVSGPRTRFDAATIDRILPDLRETATAMSRGLGARPSRDPEEARA